jgi:hypothetical protein
MTTELLWEFFWRPFKKSLFENIMATLSEKPASSTIT